MENSALATPRGRVHHEPRRDVLARRVLEMDDYVAELREPKQTVATRLRQQFGVRTVPIPVPLAPGETEAQYEQRYQKQHGAVAAGRRITDDSERVNRCNFAVNAARAYVARLKHRPAPDTPVMKKKNESEAAVTAPTEPARPPRQICERLGHVRDTIRFIDLDQYRRDYRAGKFTTYKTWTAEEKTAHFGVPVVPIFVPLARGETPQQFEDRFVDWLETEVGTTLAAVRKLPNKATERCHRMRFATLNGNGQLHFNPVRFPKRPHADDSDDDDDDQEPEPSTKRLRLDHDDATPSHTVCTARDATSLNACVQCRCNACLLRGMVLLSQKISSLGTKCSGRKSKPKRSDNVVVLDLTLDEDDDERHPHTSHTHSLPAKIPTHEALVRILKVDADHVEEKLQSDYDLLNEQILLNQEALDASVAELAHDPPIHMKEMAQLHEENEEVRELIAGECGNRTQALALLVLYQWRHDRDGLERMLRDPNASDVVHVQQLSHRKCAVHASEMDTIKQQLMTLQPQMNKDGDAWRIAHSRLEDLQYQRRYECVVLVHFDQHLRQLLLALLRRLDP